MPLGSHKFISLASAVREVDVEYLIVGGGASAGSGGTGGGGGGGAGGMIEGTFTLDQTGTFLVTVGSGGSATIKFKSCIKCYRF